jgi:hypothetical protein
MSPRGAVPVKFVDTRAHPALPRPRPSGVTRPPASLVAGVVDPGGRTAVNFNLLINFAATPLSQSVILLSDTSAAVVAVAVNQVCGSSGVWSCLA